MRIIQKYPLTTTSAHINNLALPLHPVQTISQKYVETFF